MSDAAQLHRRALQSLGWSYGASAATALVQIGTTAALARLLTPADYGVVAVAAGVVRLLQYLTDLGIAQTATQMPGLTRDDAATLFLAGLTANAALLVALCLGAPLLPRLASDLPEGSVALLRALAAAGLLASAGQTASALLARRLDFRRLGLIGIAATLAGQGMVALPLALAGWGAWALVGGTLAQAGLSAALAWASVRHPLWPARRPGRLGGLVGRCLSFSALRVLDAVAMQSPPLVIAALDGATAAGAYDRCYALILVPLDFLAAGVSRVLFPLYGQLADTAGDAGTVYRTSLMLATALLSAVALGIAVTADEIVALLLGPGWHAAAALAPWVAGWALLRGLAHLPGALCEGLGALGLRKLHQLTYVVALVALLATLRPSSAVGALQIFLAVDVVAQLVLVALAARLVQVPEAAALACVAAGLLPGALAAGAVLLLLATIEGSPVARIALALPVGGGMFAVGLLVHPSRALRHRVQALLASVRAPS